MWGRPAVAVGDSWQGVRGSCAALGGGSGEEEQWGFVAVVVERGCETVACRPKELSPASLLWNFFDLSSMVLLCVAPFYVIPLSLCCSFLLFNDGGNEL